MATFTLIQNKVFKNTLVLFLFLIGLAAFVLTSLTMLILMSSFNTTEAASAKTTKATKVVSTPKKAANIGACQPSNDLGLLCSGEGIRTDQTGYNGGFNFNPATGEYDIPATNFMDAGYNVFVFTDDQSKCGAGDTPGQCPVQGASVNVKGAEKVGFDTSRGAATYATTNCTLPSGGQAAATHPGPGGLQSGGTNAQGRTTIGGVANSLNCFNAPFRAELGCPAGYNPDTSYGPNGCRVEQQPSCTGDHQQKGMPITCKCALATPPTTTPVTTTVTTTPITTTPVTTTITTTITTTTPTTTTTTTTPVTTTVTTTPVTTTMTTTPVTTTLTTTPPPPSTYSINVNSVCRQPNGNEISINNFTGTIPNASLYDDAAPAVERLNKTQPYNFGQLNYNDDLWIGNSVNTVYYNGNPGILNTAQVRINGNVVNTNLQLLTRNSSTQPGTTIQDREFYISSGAVFGNQSNATLTFIYDGCVATTTTTPVTTTLTTTPVTTTVTTTPPVTTTPIVPICTTIAARVSRNGATVTLTNGQIIIPGETVTFTITGSSSVTGTGYDVQLNTTTGSTVVAGQQSTNNPGTYTYTIPNTANLVSVGIMGYALSGTNRVFGNCQIGFSVQQPTPLLRIDKVAISITKGNGQVQDITGPTRCVGVYPNGCNSVTVEPGDRIRYRLVVRNLGDVAINNVVLRDTLSNSPAGAYGFADTNNTNIPANRLRRCTAYDSALGICTGYDNNRYETISQLAGGTRTAFPVMNTDTAPHVAWNAIATLNPRETYESELIMQVYLPGNYSITNTLSVTTSTPGICTLPTDSGCYDRIIHRTAVVPITTTGTVIGVYTPPVLVDTGAANTPIINMIFGTMLLIMLGIIGIISKRQSDIYTSKSVFGADTIHQTMSANSVLQDSNWFDSVVDQQYSNTNSTIKDIDDSESISTYRSTKDLKRSEYTTSALNPLIPLQK